MSDTLDEQIDEQTFFSKLGEAGLHELLIESFRDDKELFNGQGISFEYRRRLNCSLDIYYLKTDHPLYGNRIIRLEKKYK